MPNLSYVDFIPHLIDERVCFSTLSLSAGVPGPKFETYDSLVERANTWLRQNPRSRVISCETLVIEGIYEMDDDDGFTDDKFDDHRFPAYTYTLRVWFTTEWEDDPDEWDDAVMIGTPSRQSCRLAYKTILPSRLESNPDAFGPKYETLSDTMRAFNRKMSVGEESIQGRLISMETCTCHFTTRNCGVDPNKTFWMTARKTDVHSYNFFRVFYIVGPTKWTEIGFQDISPQYTGNPKKARTVKSESFLQLARRAEQWCQTQTAQLLNVQTLDHNMFFRCLRDSMGTERRILDNPHCVHNHGNSIFHTKVLRLYYAKCASSNEKASRQHILHKTFHVPQPVVWSSVQINGNPEVLMPHAQFEEAMVRIRRWINLKGVKVTGVETVRVMTSSSRDSVSAEETHFESHVTKSGSVVYAIRLYVEDEHGSLSKKDLAAEPHKVKLSDQHCIIL